jgi:hypothetical protein
MGIKEILEVAAAVLASLGGGGLIVFKLSDFLGKLWAERLMSRERAKYDRELAEFRAKLEQFNQEKLTELQTQLGIYRETYLKEHNDKIAIYRLATDIIAEFLADLNLVRLGGKPEGNSLDRFNRGRLKAHGYLAMLAPQKVMDAYDALVDYSFEILEKKPPGNAFEEWKEIRRLVYELLNAVREDIGIDKSKIEYRGKR